LFLRGDVRGGTDWCRVRLERFRCIGEDDEFIITDDNDETGFTHVVAFESFDGGDNEITLTDLYGETREFTAENITGLDAIEHEFSNNVLILHKKGRKIAYLTDLATTYASNKPGDTTSRIIGSKVNQKYSHVKYALYFTLEFGVPLRREVVEKLVRLQPTYEPQSAVGFFIFLDVAYDDSYDVSNVVETSEDVIITLDEETYDAGDVDEDFDDTITIDASVFLHSVEFPPSAGGINGLSNSSKISEYIPLP